MFFAHSSLQFTPAIRPCLQTIAIGLVAFGENYKRHQSGIGQHHLTCSCSLCDWATSLSFIDRTHPSSYLFHIPPWPLTVYLSWFVCVLIVDALSSNANPKDSLCSAPYSSRFFANARFCEKGLIEEDANHIMQTCSSYTCSYKHTA